MDVIKLDLESTSTSEGQLSGISTSVAQSISQILFSLYARLSLKDRLPDGKHDFRDNLGNREVPGARLFSVQHSALFDNARGTLPGPCTMI